MGMDYYAMKGGKKGRETERQEKKTQKEKIWWEMNRKRGEGPRWREKIQIEREGGTEKESPIRHRSSSEGGREALTTDSVGVVGARTGLYSKDKVTMNVLKRRHDSNDDNRQNTSTNGCA